MSAYRAVWFVRRAGRQFGPLSREQLLRLAQAGELLPVDLLWKPGMATWKPAHLVDGVFTPPPPPVASLSSAPPSLPPELRRHGGPQQPTFTQQRHSNFIVAHWRGDLPLWVSYWVCAFLGILVFGLIALLVETVATSEQGYEPRAIFFMVMTTWTAGLLIWSWQLLGVWRAASKYKADRLRCGRHVVWGGLAQATTVLAVLALLRSMVTVGAPQLAETYRMAWLDDPDMPTYALRIMRNGTEVEIIGGFKYGLTADFLRIARAAPQLRVVHLNSLGGRIGEAKKLNRAIQERQLLTYVSHRCLSACALAFAGGRERWVRKGAVLGFHKASFPGMDATELPDAQKEERELFLVAGIEASFIDRALTTPHNDMWTPSISELLRAKVVTSVANGTEFAVSGLSQDFTREEMEAKLIQAIPAYERLKQRLPDKFASIIDDFHQGYVGGQTEQVLIAATRKKFLPLIQHYLPLADDDVLLEYGKLITEQYAALAAVDPELCYLYASGAGGGEKNFSSDIPPSLLQREVVLQGRVIDTAAERPKATEKMTAPLWEEVVSRVGSEDLALVVEAKAAPGTYDRYCNASITLLKAIIELPPDKAGLLLREFWSEAFSEAAAGADNNRVP